MLTQCWLDFKNGLSEVIFLSVRARTASTAVVLGSSISEQQIYVRAAIVLLASHMEAFFRAIPEEFVDDVTSGSVSALSSGVQRYVVLQAIQAVNAQIERVEDGHDPKQRRAFYESLVKAGRWIKDPKRLGEAPKPELQGFYRQRNVESINKYIVSFSAETTGFFDWLASKGLDKSRFATVLKGLINARNEIAHGNAALSLGVQDLRDYIATMTVMLRMVRRYVGD